MKVRTDFVTNSSSSSFVLSFKSDTDMKSALERFRNKYGDIYYDALAEEILSSKWTKSMVLKEIKHYLLELIRFRMYCDEMEYWKNECRKSGLNPEYDNCIRLPEFKQILKSKLDLEMQKVYVRMPKRGVYAVFDCGDDTDLEYTLQYKIMPYEPNVIYTMNRH